MASNRHPEHFLHGQSGGAIVYVFIGIILFALLAFTFSRSSNQVSTGNLTSGQAKVAASEVIAYGERIQKAVQTMLTKGISEEDLDFNNPVTLKRLDGTSITMTNPQCLNTDCKVFDPQGGKVRGQLPSPNALGSSATFTSSYPILGGSYPHMIQILDVGTALPEIVYTIHGLNQDTCTAINKILGINLPSGEPPLGDSTQSSDHYNGSMTSSTIYGDSVSETPLKGKTRFCMRYDVAATLYVYQHVLVAR